LHKLFYFVFVALLLLLSDVRKKLGALFLLRVVELGAATFVAYFGTECETFVPLCVCVCVCVSYRFSGPTHAHERHIVQVRGAVHDGTGRGELVAMAETTGVLEVAALCEGLEAH
jgi:hypothetical protein